MVDPVVKILAELLDFAGIRLSPSGFLVFLAGLPRPGLFVGPSASLRAAPPLRAVKKRLPAGSTRPQKKGCLEAAPHYKKRAATSSPSGWFLALSG
jgi:hypothetical protein